VADESVKELLFGKTAKVELADGKEYIMREPSIESLESIELNLDKLDDLKNLKKLAWLLLKDDNANLSEKQVGRLITMSMLSDSAPFVKTILSLIGRGGDSKKA